jgi:broad specificity phosphatase PhoE
MRKISVFLSALLSIFILDCISDSKQGPSASKFKPVVIFAVRHAEKLDASKDPELSEAGKVRAGVLAQTLRDAKIDHVHATPYIRTQNTAAPTAEAYGKKVQKYDPRNLPLFVEKIRKMGGRHLVVGHSNTTPALVQLLTGAPCDVINEKEEFDRLYILSVDRVGQTSSILIRYGKPFFVKSGK